MAYLRATRIGFIFQQFFLAEHSTVVDNVAEGLLYAGIPSTSAANWRSRRSSWSVSASAPRLVPPSSREGSVNGWRSPGRSSGSPAIVLADEPTGNLDQATGQSILALIDELHEAGSTIVVITHDHAIAGRMPRRVEILDGRIVTDTRSVREVGMSDANPERRRLPIADLTRLSTVGLRTRKLRAGLSALGIAIGVAAIVAVLGLSASSQAGLLAEINQLGTNLLTATNGQSVTGGIVEMPAEAPAMIGRIAGVQQAQSTGAVSGVGAFRNPLIPSAVTNGLTVQAASLRLLPVIATTVAEGQYLNAATAQEPVAVLGATSARLLGLDRAYPGERIWVDGRWFYVAGILRPAVLASDIDTSVLVGYPAAEKYLGFDGHPSTVYLRAQNQRVDTVDTLLAPSANPENPSGVNVSQPSAALVAQAEAKGAFDGLFLGLGAVALLVGAVGVANIMIISVLERRSEIGLRRALGATKAHIRTQFLSEAVLLGLLGGRLRRRRRRDGNRHLRPHQTLVDRHPARSLGRRHCLLPPHRGGRRARTGTTSRAPFPGRSPVVHVAHAAVSSHERIPER